CRRRRPAQVRARNQREPRPTVIRGVSLSTSRALDRLDRPRLTSGSVRTDLLSWRRVTLKPRSTLQRENNDWVQFIGPFSRDVLEQALHALPRHRRASLRRQIAQLDARFLDKTLNNPTADPSLPWWWRRT
ncbi:MAG: hypothetical protein ACQEXM_27600, partial [Actinomycetota bacterium]